MSILKPVIVLCLATLFLSSPSYANDAQDIFYQAFYYAKKDSPFSQKVNWEEIEAKALAFIGDRTVIPPFLTDIKSRELSRQS